MTSASINPKRFTDLGLLLFFLLFFPLTATTADDHHHDNPANQLDEKPDHDDEHGPSCAGHDHADLNRSPGLHERVKSPQPANYEADEHAAGEPDHTEPKNHDYVHLSPEKAARFGISWAPVGGGRLTETITAPGTVAFNQDQLTRITPPIGGIVTQVLKKLGDRVEAGEIVASLCSRELAEIRGAYLRAREDFAYREQIFQREQQMRRAGANAAAEFQAAARDCRLAEIELALQRRRLLDLGFSPDELTELKPGDPLSEFHLPALRAGEIIDRQAIAGEVIDPPRALFTVADLSSVWLDLEIAAAEAGRVAIGQKVFLADLSGRQLGHGEISYLAPMLDDGNRTRKARLLMPGNDLRPGSYIQGRIAILTAALSPLLLPRDCPREVEGRTVVFVKDDHGFRVRPVKTGRENEHQVEIIAGLKPGEEVVVAGSFQLKAELETGVGSGCNSPGHNH
ncbi:MAG: efflux RND transporter periplasmic adaptor subunit [Deltaproteobacteria bacterium]|nr:efflux RND transporter periplasmic adaptor subunit [Deltaproteobacteria bacterium]